MATKDVSIKANIKRNLRWSETRPGGDSNLRWVGLGSSSDGSKKIAVTTMDSYSVGGRIWISNDFGATWTESQPIGNVDHSWSNAASDSTGNNLIVTAFGGDATLDVFISHNAGTSWTPVDPPGLSSDYDWFWCSSDDDGSVLTVASDSQFYISTNSGVAWTKIGGSGCSSNCALSSDGSKMYYTDDLYYRLYYSSNSGVSWTQLGSYPISPGPAYIACDDTGAYVYVVQLDASVYMSSDYGSTWSDITPSGYANNSWSTIQCSSDGKIVFATVEGGRVFISYNYGTNWEEVQPGGNVNKAWWTSTMDSEGKRFAVGEDSGRLYLGESYATLGINSVSKANIVATYSKDNNVTNHIAGKDNYVKFNVIPPDVYSYDSNVKFHVSTIVFKKYYEYRVYTRLGQFITNWMDEVLSEPTFKMVINGGPGEMVVKLARKFDSFGEDYDVALFNRIEVYCFDKDAVSGTLIYSGYISGYRPILEDSAEYVEITILHFVSEMSNISLRDGTGNTDIVMNSTDPSNMLKNVVGYYRADDGLINYDATSIDLTGTVVSYDFKTYDIKEAIDKIIELTPQYWYWFVDANNVIYLKYSDLLSAQHSFVLGRHISRMETWRRGEDIVNRVYFVGAETAGVAMYRVYSNTGSIASYGIHSTKLVDQRVSLTATADIIANRVINHKKDPEIRTSITILDNNGWDSGKGYDIESIKPGQTMRIKNLKQGVKTVTRWDQFTWDDDVWDQTLSYAASDNIQIQSVEYHPDYVVLEASSRTPDIAKRVEDVYRNLKETQTLTTPGDPVVG